MRDSGWRVTRKTAGPGLGAAGREAAGEEHQDTLDAELLGSGAHGRVGRGHAQRGEGSSTMPLPAPLPLATPDKAVCGKDKGFLASRQV